MSKSGIIVGNSDGIGLALTARLTDLGWRIAGISRSGSPFEHPDYEHHVVDVRSTEFGPVLTDLAARTRPCLVVYAAGIGELLDPLDMQSEVEVFEVNLMGLVRTASVVLPGLVRQGSGHLVGLSSLADELLSAEAPSYHASKAGFSNYLGGLALALRPKGVYVTNVRFGFVDTKMAKGDVRPLMMSVDRSVAHLERCLEQKPAVYTTPKTMVPLIKFRKWMMKLGL